MTLSSAGASDERAMGEVQRRLAKADQTAQGAGSPVQVSVAAPVYNGAHLIGRSCIP